MFIACRYFYEVFDNGYKKLYDYVQNLTESQFLDILTKMDIQDKTTDIISNDHIKSLSADAAKLGIIEDSLNEDI